MTNLDRIAVNAKKFGEMRALRKLEFKNAIPKTWRSRKFIPKEEWCKRFAMPLGSEYLNFMPDVFIDDTLFYDVPNGNEAQVNRDKWLNDYYAFWGKRKDAKYGSAICRRCPLYGEDDKFGINNVLVKIFQSCDEDYKNPCPVLDIFKCPHGDEKVVRSLLLAGEIQRIVIKALQYAGSLVKKYNKNKYIDFKRNMVWDDISLQFKFCDVFSAMDGVTMPRIFLNSVNDIYNVLTHKEQMEIVLDQLVDATDAGNFKITWYDPGIKVDVIRELKSTILKTFEQYRNIVDIHELKNFDGETLEQEEEFKSRHPKFLLELEETDPNRLRDIQEMQYPRSCITCNKNTRIFCINCNIAICLDHWAAHGLEKHNFVAE